MGIRRCCWCYLHSVFGIAYSQVRFGFKNARGGASTCHTIIFNLQIKICNFCFSTHQYELIHNRLGLVNAKRGTFVRYQMVVPLYVSKRCTVKIFKTSPRAAKPNFTILKLSFLWKNTYQFCPLPVLIPAHTVVNFNFKPSDYS